MFPVSCAMLHILVFPTTIKPGAGKASVVPQTGEQLRVSQTKPSIQVFTLCKMQSYCQFP